MLMAPELITKQHYNYIIKMFYCNGMNFEIGFGSLEYQVPFALIKYYGVIKYAK